MGGVVDFAEEAMGKRWQKYIEDAVEVQESVQTLWEESLFGIPLKEVIQTAHHHSALISLKSAVSKMADFDRLVIRYLDLCHNVIHKGIEEIQGHIKAHEDDLRLVGTAERESRKMAELSIQNLQEKVSELF